MTLISSTSGKASLVCSLVNYGENDKRALQISHGDTKSALTITFERTLRVPDNNNVNFLPPTLGKFPLFSVAEYKQRLPPDMAAKGGVFFPMMQREAMWMRFSAQRPFAVKIYVGGVNAISGVPITETPEAAKERLKTSGKVKQDYVVLPDQPWLDGIATEDGQIRQFVAMPKGSGYSVEAQVTGEEKIDGIQFEVTPVKLGCHDVLNMRYTSELGLIRSSPLNKTVPVNRVLNPESTVMDLKKLAAQEFGFKISNQIFTITSETSVLGSTTLGEVENSKKLSSMYFHPDAVLDVKERPEVLPPSRNLYRHSAKGFGSSEFKSGALAFSGPPPPPAAAPIASMSLEGALPPSYSYSYPIGGPAGQPSAPGAQQSASSAMPQMLSQSSDIEAPRLSDSANRVARKRRAQVADTEDLMYISTSPVTVKPAAEVKVMGLAAGGLVQQSINIDNYPPSIWDSSSSILFNVQLLNWEAFEAVTGRAPPDPPIDAKTYAQHNMPFFQIWNEEKTGVKGDFAKVKSIGEIDETKAAEKKSFWEQMKGEGGTAGEKENEPSFKRDESLEFPIVLLDMGHRSLFKPVKELEADLAKMKLGG